MIDKPAFRRLLQYTRSSLSEKDIPHRTKLTDTIKSRAKAVVETIKGRLTVSTDFSHPIAARLIFPRMSTVKFPRHSTLGHQLSVNHSFQLRVIISGILRKSRSSGR